jgi:hypothetical protein
VPRGKLLTVHRISQEYTRLAEHADGQAALEMHLLATPVYLAAIRAANTTSRAVA